MKTDTAIVYSNDLCSAFLTAIVKSFEDRHPSRYLGRTAMQKLAYFAKALNVPIPCSFGIYTYGPYSDTITFSVESLLADEILVDRSTNPKYSNYRTYSNSAELLSAYAEEVKPHEDTINRIVEALGEFDPSDLELIATLHFVARRQKQRTGKLNKAAIIAEFKSIKKDKFTGEAIGTWYNALQQANLI
ncbi:MAG: hypothetical protein M3Y72_12455 [Acidobacteriota bacterium]|nr:hypothetical protein [Acidobacteriota bacterium]